MNEGTKWIRVQQEWEHFFRKKKLCQQIKITCNVLFHNKKSRKLKIYFEIHVD